MLFLTQDARLVCTHETGRVDIVATQDLVTIRKRAVLVEKDPEGRPIWGCSNVGPGIKPCLATLAVQVGYSPFLRVQGRGVCLSSVTGFTEGTPPGVPKYEVRQTGQDFVSEVA